MSGFFRFILLINILFSTSCSKQELGSIQMDDLYPWCIVAYDSMERNPSDRINLINDLGFVNYAYDWRDKHLDDTESEIKLADQNDIKVISVWLWLNAKRDSLKNLSPANKKVIDIVKRSNLKTTFWLSFNNNFFEEQSQQESVQTAVDYIEVIHHEVSKFGCKIALYNHSGWFGNPFNQIEVIEALPNYDLSMVFNFHHAFNYIDNFPEVAHKITPYLSAVNLNGMKKGGPKILTIGKGDHELDMIKTLMESGYSGLWGILGHVEGADVSKILTDNINGLVTLNLLKENGRDKN